MISFHRISPLIISTSFRKHFSQRILIINLIDLLNAAHFSQEKKYNLEEAFLFTEVI